MQHFSLRAVTVALFAAWGVAQADVERDLDSHEHGAASLNLVVDGNRVFVEFSSPWANVAGFEHAPSTQEQHAVVDKALADLADADALMVFTGTRCARVDSQVSSTMGEGGSEHDHHDEHKEHEHKEHEHKEHEHKEHEHKEHEHKEHEHKEHEHKEHEHKEHEHKEHEEHEEHDHEHHDHDEHASAHSEVEVVYTFECDASSKLDSVSVAFFERWSGIEKMQVQMAGPGGQSAMTLTPAQTAIDLTKIR